MSKTCTVPGCNRSYHKWKRDGEKESMPYVYRVKGLEILKKWREAVKPESVSKDLPICDIHFRREDFFPSYPNKFRPLYLRNLGKRPDAIPSLYLDKHLNLAARKRAEELNEPNWWKLLESPNDYNFDIDSVPRPEPVITNTVTSNESEETRIDLDLDVARQFKLKNKIANILASKTQLLPKPVPSDQDITLSDVETIQLSCDDMETLSNEVGIQIYTFSDPENPFCTVEYSAELNASSLAENNGKDIEDDLLVRDDSDNSGDYEPVSAQQKVKTKGIIRTNEDIELQQKLQQEVAENAKKRLKLFRALCTSPLKLPSSQWAVQPNFDDHYVVISKVSHSSLGFCVERGICFQSDMSWPDIRINGEIISLDVMDITCLDDIERLVAVVDNK